MLRRVARAGTDTYPNQVWLPPIGTDVDYGGETVEI